MLIMILSNIIITLSFFSCFCSFLLCLLCFFFFFFFSSRRRHTRSDRDWSSDVCSSDLDFGRGVAGVDTASISSSTLESYGRRGVCGLRLNFYSRNVADAHRQLKRDRKSVV